MKILRNIPFGAVLFFGLFMAAAVLADDEKETGDKASETPAASVEAADKDAEPKDADGEQAEAKHEESDHDSDAHEDDGHSHEGEGHDHEGEGHEGEGHGGGHHNSLDLMHANVGAGLTDPAEFKSDLAIFSAVVFLLLMLVLGKFAWGPISAGLDAREQGIAGQIAAAKKAAEDAEQTLVQYQAQVAGAAEEVRQMLDKGRRDADTQRQEIIAEAQQVAQREKDRAISEIQNAKNDALQEVAQQSADTAVSLAGQIVRRELNKDDHDRLIADAIQQFPSKN